MNFDKMIEFIKVLEGRKVFKFEDIEITVVKEDNKARLWGFNKRTERYINLNANKYSTLLNCLKGISSHFTATDNVCYITIKANDEPSEKQTIVEITETIESTQNNSTSEAKLNKIILEQKNKILELKNELNKALKELQRYKEIDEKRRQGGKLGGRPTKVTEDDISAMKIYRSQGLSIKKIAELFGISVGSVYRYLNNK